MLLLLDGHVAVERWSAVSGGATGIGAALRTLTAVSAGIVLATGRGIRGTGSRVLLVLELLQVPLLLATVLLDMVEFVAIPTSERLGLGSIIVKSFLSRAFAGAGRTIGAIGAIQMSETVYQLRDHVELGHCGCCTA